MAFKKKARSLGVEYINDTVVGLNCTSSSSLPSSTARIDAVHLQNLGKVSGFETFINVMGRHSAEIFKMIGEDFPVRPKKRNVFVFSCSHPDTKTIHKECPLVVDPSGVYFRSETSGNFIVGSSGTETSDLDANFDDFEVDYHLFDDFIWPALAHRVPAFEAIKMTHGWVGHYDYNIIDQNAIVGQHHRVKNMFYASGFSGHGLQQSPAIGRAISELILEGAYQTLDLSRFSFERFFNNQPVSEINIV